MDWVGGVEEDAIYKNFRVRDDDDDDNDDDADGVSKRLRLEDAFEWRTALY